MKNKRGLFFGCRFNDTLDDFHVVDVECADCVTACVCFLNISVVVTNGIVLPPKFISSTLYNLAKKNTTVYIKISVAFGFLKII